MFGNIEPRIGDYFVSKNHMGKYVISKDEPWYVTNAVLADPVLMWNGIEPFDSLVQAYTWLKQNVKNLL